MQDAVTQALALNPEVLAATTRLADARAGKSVARASLYPQVRVSTSGGQSTNLTALSGSGTTEQADTTVLGVPNYFMTTRLSVSQALLDWGRNGLSIDLSDLEEMTAFEQLRAARQDVALQARTAFLALVSARSAAKLRTEAADRGRTRLETTKKRQTRGTATDLEALQAEARSLALEQEARKASREARKAQAGLAVLLDRDPDSPVEISGFELIAKSLPDLKQARSRAAEARPDARVSAILNRQESFKLDVEGKNQWPTLSWSASGGWISSSALSTKSLLDASKQDFSVMGSLSWNVFDGFRSGSIVRKAELSLERVARSRNQLLAKIAAEVATERDAAIDAEEREGLANRERAISRKALDVALRRLERGVATDLDVLEAELAVLEAEQRAQQAAFDRSLAEARLIKATGEDPPEIASGLDSPPGWQAP